MKIKSTKDDTNNYLNVLIYGEPGSGKTTFGGTSHAPLFLSAESGLLSLNKLGNFDYVEIKKFQDIIGAYEHLATSKEAKYKTIVIDSLTELQTICMDAILEENKRDKPRIDDWGTLNNRMINMIRKFRDLNLNLIVTCLAETVEGEDGFGTKIIPSIQGKLKFNLPGYFDEVFLAYSAEKKDDKGAVTVEHALLTHGTKKYIAKDRSGMLDRRENPDFNYIHNKIYGGK